MRCRDQQIKKEQKTYQSTTAVGLTWFQIQPVKVYGICETIRKVNIEWIIDNVKELLFFVFEVLLFKVCKLLFLMAQTVKNLPPVQETWVWSLEELL